MDSFCLEANIHFPVDWVLLRDAARTLIKSIKCIRSHGLRHRIPAPEELARKMNSLCIEMANSRRNKNAKKRRKNVFRRMKALVGVIKEHALRYRDILNAKLHLPLKRRIGQIIILRLMRGDYAHFLPKRDNSFGTYSCFRKKLSKTSCLYISSISRMFYLSKYWVLRTGSSYGS